MDDKIDNVIIENLDVDDTITYSTLSENPPKKKWRKRKNKFLKYNYVDPIRLFRNLETIFKGIRKEEIQQWDKNLLIVEKKKVKKKLLSFLQYSLLGHKQQQSEQFSVLFKNVRLITFKAGKFKGGYRFFKTTVLSHANVKAVRFIFWCFLFILFVLFKKYIRSRRYRLARNNRKVEALSEFFEIDNFYFFYNKYFENFFFFHPLIQSLQISYTMDNYQENYLIDLYNINCIYEWNPLYIQLNFNKLLTIEGDAIRPKVKILGYKSPFKKKLILYWLTNPDFRPRWTLDYYNLDFSHYTGTFFFIYCIFEYLSDEFFYNYSFIKNSCYNYLFNTFKADFFDKHRLYTGDFYDYKEKIINLRLYKKYLLKNFYFKKVSIYQIKKKVKSIINAQKWILYCTSKMEQNNHIGSFFRIIPLTVNNVKKYIFVLRKYARIYLRTIPKQIKKIAKIIKPYRYNDLLRLFNHFIPLRKFIIFLPYTFFILYTFYCLYYRRVRYAYYIRNQTWLSEYTSVKSYYTVNHPRTRFKNTNVLYWKFWKIWSLQKLRLSKQNFTNRFALYAFQYTKRDYFIEFDHISIHNNFNFIDQFDGWYFCLKKEIFPILRDVNKDFQWLIHFRLISNKWKFFIRFKSVYKFFLANTDYGPDINELIEMMYSLSEDNLMYLNNINFKILYKFYLQIYFENFQNYYFLQDFFFFNNKLKLFNVYKLNLLYLNILYIIIYATDPKIFWQFYFLYGLQTQNIFLDFIFEISFYLFFFTIENFDLINNLYYLVVKLRWHWNINYYYMYYNYEYFIANTIVDLIKKMRLKTIWQQMNYYLLENKIKSQRFYKYSKYEDTIIDLYFLLLFKNIEYLLLLFFLDLDNSFLVYSDFNNWFYNKLQFYWNSALSYRYSTYNNICTFEHYYYWFWKRDLFDLWIYADEELHEGKYCYRSNINELF